MSAAVTLRQLRREAGLSQEELAHRSRLSARTIRTLESGSARRPHRDTLLAVAQALELGGAQRAAFVASWRGSRLAMADVFRDRNPKRAVERELTRQRELIRDLAVELSVNVRADRWLEVSRIRRTFEVVGEGLDRYLWLASLDFATVDPGRVTVRSSTNLDVADTFELPESGAKAFLGVFGQTLPPGTRYVLDYEIDYTAARRDPTGPADPEVDTLFVAATPMQLLTVQARFDVDALPARLWQVRHESVTGPEEVVGDVAVSPFGLAQVVLAPAPSGVHGIRWSWD
ncbi:Helix-turn-helix domain-containing protein [Jatrophihabitans endophyticus]|uniref:Helix-turn-helix domain-containing protein n=1 Tax=Jatrophihabitans endophyticus TaxID=1206085 RepID=A0A1M5RGY0_9ACTN|nr:Helix-turn-helix domain-containing protein [Jatrophihabitans endophyticus]